jgi:hypothetical protein
LLAPRSGGALVPTSSARPHPANQAEPQPRIVTTADSGALDVFRRGRIVAFKG